MFMPRQSPATTRQRIAARISTTCAVIVSVGGLAVMAGWQFRLWWLKTPMEGAAPVIPSVALALVLCGLVLLLKGSRRVHTAVRAFADLLSLAVALFAAATVVEYAFGVDLGIDRVIFAHRLTDWTLAPPAGRMALATAITLVLSGVGLLLVDESRECYSTGQLCAAGALFVSFAVILGYVYRVEALYTLTPAQSAAAVLSAMLTSVLGIGIIFARGNVGLAALLIGSDAGAIMARRLFAATVIAIPSIGFGVLHLHGRGLLDRESETALMVMGCVTVFAVMIFTTGRILRLAHEERESAMGALTESEERLRIATSAAQMGVWLWDVSTDDVFLSEKARELFGLSFFVRNLKNEQLMQRVYAEDCERVRSTDASTVAHGGDYENEYRVLLPGGELRWLAVKGRVLNSASRRIVGVVWDTTERKHAEIALVRSEKLASVGRMAATMAHEINNPLAAVTNVLYLVANDPALSEQTVALVRTAEEELKRVTHITKQTLGFYREHASSPAPFEVNALVENVHELYSRRLEQKHIVVQARLQDEHATVRGIAGELRQVISNLVANSIDALPAAGTLYLRTSVLGHSLRITVADTGTGIAPEIRKRIFEPFFTTKEAVGTGLGLWITKEIVDKHKGHIRLRSKIGRGTVFCIFLPVESTGSKERVARRTPKGSAAVASQRHAS